MSARVQHATITFNGSAQRLSTVLPNIGLRQISIQADSANANVFYWAARTSTRRITAW